MSTALDIDEYTLKEERWATGEKVVDAVKQLAVRQSKCATVHSGGGMFRKLVCNTAEDIRMTGFCVLVLICETAICMYFPGHTVHYFT